MLINIQFTHIVIYIFYGIKYRVGIKTFRTLSNI